MTVEKMQEILALFSFERWEEAVRVKEDVIIPDTSLLKDTNPMEYTLFRRCKIKSILAIACARKPLRFLVVCNPKKNMDRTRYLETVELLFFSRVTRFRLFEENKDFCLTEKIQNDKDVVICLFGDVEIYTKKGSLNGCDINSPKFCRVLTYLLLHRTGPVSAREISEEVWFDEDSGNHSDKIKSLISRFKKVFSRVSEYPLIVSTPDGYRLNPELNVITDIQVFDELYSQARKEIGFQKKVECYQKALALYKADLFSLAYLEHWILPRQVAYKNMYLEMFQELMKLCFAFHDFWKAQYYVHQAMQNDRRNVDINYWRLRLYKEIGSSSMIKESLESLKTVLLEEKYDELLSRLL